MNISNKITELYKKAANNQKAKTILMSAVVGVSSPVFSQTPQQTKQDIASSTITQTITTQAKHYHRIVNITSVRQMNDYNAAEYNQLFDGIVYTQFHMENADDNAKLEIDKKNKYNYSAQIEAHEQQHRAFHVAGISTKVDDGSCILSSADVIKSKILEELLCKKAENPNRPMSEVINDFNRAGHDNYYARHYQNDAKRISILSIMQAEEKCPDKIYKSFNETTQYKIIDENHYASLYKSADNKYQVWEVFHNDGYLTQDNSVIEKAPVNVRTLLDKDGNEVTNQDGNIIEARACLRIGSNYIDGFLIDNIDKETQGYDFSKSQNNFNNLCQEYMDFVKLSPEDRISLTNYINNDLAYLSQYNQSDNEIAEIKEIYKGVTLEEQQAKHKQNYQENMRVWEQKAQQKMENNLIPVSAPSDTKGNKTNTTAFYRGR